MIINLQKIILFLCLIVLIGGCRSQEQQELSGTTESTITPVASEQPGGGTGHPSVVVTTPIAGQQVRQGKPVEVVSGSIDSLGIERVELFVDEGMMDAIEIVPQPGALFAARQTWIPEEPGRYNVQVRAYNPANQVGESKQITVQVVPANLAVNPAMGIGTPLRPPQGDPTDSTSRESTVSPTAEATDSPTPSPTPTTTSTATPSSSKTPARSSATDTLSFPKTPQATPTLDFPYMVVTVGTGLNVRAGPSTRYQTLGLLNSGDVAQILGQMNIGAGRWWQIRYPSAPEGIGWVSASPDYSQSFNISDVPEISAPATPIPPTFTPTPTAVPTAEQASLNFNVDRTSIQAGECVTFSWHVINVKEVYFEGQGVPGEDQTRRECPQWTEYYELRVVGQDGRIESRTIKIDVYGQASYSIVELDPGESIDFDNHGRVSRDGDDFEWDEDDDEWRFMKWDDDDDLRLIPVGPVDSLDVVREEDCDWAYDHLDDQEYIEPFDGLAVCFQTDDGRDGKLRFPKRDDSIEIEWRLW